MSCTLPEPPEPHHVSAPVLSTRARSGATTLAELTTIGVGGTFTELVEATTETDVVDTVRRADAAGTPLLVIGGGSNILPADSHFDGIVLRDMRSGIVLDSLGSCEGANFSALPGTPWDDLVVHAISQDWGGFEALSGIPGTVGAAPVQNIGAYGQEVAATLARLKVYDRREERIRTLFLADMRLGYRTSILKETIGEYGPSPRYIVLEVTFQTKLSNVSDPIGYAQLARHLGVELGARVPSETVREAVLELRAGKGMVLNNADRDTYSCGSFFTNPVLTTAQAQRLPEGAPRYEVHDAAHATLSGGVPVVDGLVKTSAAWLIEHAGFTRGYGHGPARLSSKHTLALTNAGGATGAQLRALAREIQAGVKDAFGVVLHPEPVVLGGLGA
ncbi:UDP-N-acetylmuramate dehydrogenase [Actinotignum sp. GS-2025a]|uniref:UDP-N-acetylmuramate dehydrogenase n=1 Tax=Actinotignum sp. GS-2025a TaxID=3427274 RepID=UPI003F485F74